MGLLKIRWVKVKWMREGEMSEAETWSKTYGWGCGDERSEAKRRVCPSSPRKREISRSDR